MLMGMIMALTDDGNGVPKGPLAPLLIGILVAVIGASTGPLTGFAMNPARDFGPKLFTVRRVGQYRHDRGRDIPYFIVPIIAPLLGPASAPQFIVFLSPIICPVIPAWRKKIRVSVIRNVSVK